MQAICQVPVLVLFMDESHNHNCWNSKHLAVKLQPLLLVLTICDNTCSICERKLVKCYELELNQFTFYRLFTLTFIYGGPRKLRATGPKTSQI